MSLTMFYFLTITAVYILMSWSIYLPYRIGQLHFMVVANMAGSAYFAALIAINFSWPFWLILFSGTILSGIVGLFVSFVIGDAPCFSVVIVGFTFIYLTKTIIENIDIFGGSMGIFSIPKVFSDASMNRVFLLITIFFLVFVTGFLINRFEHSRLGRASSAIFVDRELAVSFGVDVKKMGIFLQTWASSIGGMSGVMYAFIMRSVSPSYFTFEILGICITMLFVGGYTTFLGPLLATPILWGFSLILPEALQSWKIVVYGILLIIVLVIKPEGIISGPMVKSIENTILIITQKIRKGSFMTSLQKGHVNIKSYINVKNKRK